MRSVARLHRVVCILLAACLLLALPGTRAPFAQVKADEPYVSKAEEAILMDARTGRVLFEKNADAPCLTDILYQVK
jgi:D-alanyl-D-alanine carboxypeptidase